MRSDYHAPPRPTRTHDYKANKHKAQTHLDGMIRKPHHAGQAQHMGGVAALIGHLDNLHYGESHMVLTELKEAMDYIVHYKNTGDAIHKFFAELEIDHARDMASHIQDAHDRKRATYFVDCVIEYLDHVTPGHHTQGSLAPTHGGGRVNL